MTSDRKSLIAAAKELNDLLELDPKIKVVAVKTEELETKIKETSKLFEEGDEISAETKTVFDALEISLPEFVKVLDPVDPPKDEEEKKEEKKETKKEEPKAEEAPEVTIEALTELAGEMNTIMGLEPEIKIDLPFDELKEEVTKNCYDDGEVQIFDTDDFSEGALATLKSLGIEPVVTVVKPNDGKKKKEEKADPKKDAGKKDSTPKPPKKEKEPKAPKEKSNKRIVFDAWNGGKGETDITALLKLVNDQVKSNTVKIWLNNWKNGKNLPAGTSLPTK